MSDTYPPHPAPEAREPADRPAVRTWIAAAVVIAIVLAGVAVSWRIAARPDPTSTTTAVPTSTGAPVADGQCPPGRIELAGTVTAAPQTMWVLVGKMAAPTVTDAGPAVIDTDGYRHCYARTPTGALVAAANLAAMGSDPTFTHRIATDGLMPGSLRDSVLASPQPSSASSGGAQLRGFRMVSYDGTTAVVDLGLQTANGAYGSAMVQLSWHEGDWRYAVRGEGPSQELAVTYSWPPTLIGFIDWSGV